MIAEWSRRWEKKVVGWWFDGCYFPNSMYRSVDAPNFASLAAAARAGNPDSSVAFNPGVVVRIISVSRDEDFTAGEINNPALVNLHRELKRPHGRYANSHARFSRQNLGPGQAALYHGPNDRLHEGNHATPADRSPGTCRSSSMEQSRNPSSINWPLWARHFRRRQQRNR